MKLQCWWNKLKTQTNEKKSRVHGQKELLLLQYPYYPMSSIESM